MARVDRFNLYPRLAHAPKVANAPASSWWADFQSDADDQWYARARVEQARMNKTKEARALNPHCLDDLKIF